MAPRPRSPQPLPTTMLELVTRLTPLTADEDETARAVVALLDAGRVRLTGSFRGQRIQLP